jgi:hypothetical protein
MNRRLLLRELTFGGRVAEEEGDRLDAYFVETDQWHRIVSGKVDVVFGAKGSGKSAIYTALLHRTDALFDEGTLLVPAEQPRGTPVFRDLLDEPPPSRLEFICLWKLYVLSLVAQALADYGIRNQAARRVLDAVRDARLLSDGRMTLRTRLRGVRDYVRRLLRPEALETFVELDPLTSMPASMGARIALAEPSASQRAAGGVSVDELLGLADDALAAEGLSVWVLFDRLDVAFAESRELESQGLRALFQAYLDLLPHSHIVLKVFLRSDIWRSITRGGFREASHITRQMTLRWTDSALLHLLSRRLLQSAELAAAYGVDPEIVVASAKAQRRFFDRLVAERVDRSRRLATFEWILAQVRDGTGQVAPRELIHLLARARELQLEKLERGENELSGETLLGAAALREAVAEVSAVRLEQTLFAEHPEARGVLQALEGEKTTHTLRSLAAIWQTTDEATALIAASLVDIGFFERRGTLRSPTYWVPFLYRPALALVQGSAEHDVARPSGTVAVDRGGRPRRPPPATRARPR